MLLTDLADVVDLLDLNVRENLDLIANFEGGESTAVAWKWGDFEPDSKEFFQIPIKEIDFLVISDCIYYESVSCFIASLDRIINFCFV